MLPRLFVSLIAAALAGSLALGNSAASSAATPQTAQLHVDHIGVEVERAGTSVWRAVAVESLIGAGDGIRTDGTGSATITFYTKLIQFQLQPGTVLTLHTFNAPADSSSFDVQIDVASGFTAQHVLDKLTDQMNFAVSTPAFDATTLTGTSLIRVEPNGRSAVLAGSAGTVRVAPQNGQAVVIPAGSGIRVPADGPASDITVADTFPLLDLRLDGCASILTVAGDAVQNVRSGTNDDSPIVGHLPNNSPVTVMGMTKGNNWSRIRMNGAFAWVNIPRSDLPLKPVCAGLLKYPDGYTEGSIVGLPTVTATATPAVTLQPTAASS